MTSPTLLVNNLVQEGNTIFIDPISKAFLIGQLTVGLNRLVLFSNIDTVSIFLGFIYSFVLSGGVFYVSFVNDAGSIYMIAVIMDSVHYILSIVLETIIWKRLRRYYEELQKFDKTIGCRVKRSASSIKNVIPLFIMLSIMSLSIPYEWYTTELSHGGYDYLHTVFLTVRLLPVISLHYLGHLLSLLVPRLSLINYYMKISLNEHGNIDTPKFEDLTLKGGSLENQNCQMKKLMDLYCLIISAYDKLIDAIKWQFLMQLTSTFFAVLSFLYIGSLMIIRGTRPFIFVAIEISFIVVRVLPMFAPCIFADQIHEEVLRLRELLASRLYENKLNKPGRSVARALLSLTETRDLSFSLLQIFNIDVSLPFKFMGLLLTYLIILLQFEKVINPSL